MERKATLYSSLDNGQVCCTACSHRCTISKNNTGICGVRKNVNGTLTLLVWGRPVAVNVDPVEKKPLYHFLPGTLILSIGTLGCNFGCEFCQNADISQASKGSGGKKIDFTSFPLQTPDMLTLCCRKNDIPSIAFTYNEPTIFTEYAVDVMKKAKKHGIRGVFVSNGYETKECLKLISPYIDAFNIDLKSFRDDFYRTICKARLQPVLDTISRLHDMGKWVEVTTLVIEGKNDSDKEFGDIAKFIKNISPDIPWHISACHPEYKMTDIKATSIQTLERAYEIGKKMGLNYIYLGNITGNPHEDTLCLKCGTTLVARDGYTVRENKIKNNACTSCGFEIKGIWE